MAARLDKFVWVEETIGTGSNGAPPPAGGFNPMEGAISMGFYNMNPYTDAAGTPRPGDAAIFKSLADQYAISDNYHQAIMGGTGANFQASCPVMPRSSPTRPGRNPRRAVRQPDREPRSGRGHQQLLHPGRLQRRLLRELRGLRARRAWGR